MLFVKHSRTLTSAVDSIFYAQISIHCIAVSSTTYA